MPYGRGSRQPLRHPGRPAPNPGRVPSRRHPSREPVLRLADRRLLRTCLVRSRRRYDSGCARGEGEVWSHPLASYPQGVYFHGHGLGERATLGTGMEREVMDHSAHHSGSAHDQATHEGHHGHADHTMSHGGHGKVSWAMAAKATLHCLTGCAIGEILGMVIGTALMWGNVQTMVLAITLAFLFG